MTDTATLIAEAAAAKAEADRLYVRYKDLTYQLIGHLKVKYPEEWSRWERGIASFNAEGVSVEVTRTYDLDKLQAEFGEERPDVIRTTEVPAHTVRSANGKLLQGWWRDAAMARRLENCLLPQVPKVKIG